MDNSNRLRRCVELAELLSNPGKVVEDDTCLERILSAANKVLETLSSEVYSTKIEHHLQELEKIWESVVEVDIRKYCSTTLNYLLKLSALLVANSSSVTELWKKSMKFMIDFPIIFTLSKSGEAKTWLLPSIGYSWITCIRVLLSMSHCHLQVLTQINLDHLINLCKVPSIFVHKEAFECLAEIAVLQSGTFSNLQILRANILAAFNKSLSLSTTIKLVNKMLEIDYPTSVAFLSSMTFSEFIELQNIEFSTYCQAGEAFLSHLFNAVFNENTRKEIPSVMETVFPSTKALEYSIQTLMNNPTKSVGWSMFTSVLTYSHVEKDTLKSSSAVLLYPINIIYKDAYTEFKNEDSYQCFKDIIDVMQSNRTQMTGVFRHSLASISKLIKSKRLFYNTNLLALLIQISDYIAGINSVDFNKSASILIDNWNVADALLNLFTDSCDQFICYELQVPLKNTILAIMRNQNTDHRVNLLCQNLALKIIKMRLGQTFLDDCIEVAVKKLLDRRWEVRDSTLEFLSNIVIHQTNNNLEIFEKYGLGKEVIRLVADNESFVKATALMLLKNLLGQSVIFDNCIKEVVLSAVLNVLTSEKEATPRRAAVLTLLECFKQDISIANDFLLRLVQKIKIFMNEDIKTLFDQGIGNTSELNVESVFLNCLFGDLDWEVKFNAIDILEYFIEKVCRENMLVQNIKNEELCRCLKYLLKNLFEDCDSAVADKAKNVCQNMFPPTNDMFESQCTVSVDEMLLIDMDNLLEEVMASLKKEKQIRLTHGCHGPSINEDSVILDCY